MIKLLLVFITRLRNKIGCCSTYVTVTEEINLSCLITINRYQHLLHKNILTDMCLTQKLGLVALGKIDHKYSSKKWRYWAKSKIVLYMTFLPTIL